MKCTILISNSNDLSVRNIKNAIAKATTLEEIERLNHMLRTGSIPGENGAPAKNGNDVEEMDDE